MVSALVYLVFLITLVMIVSTAVQFHKRRITAAWAMFWSSLWVVGSVMSFFTGLLDRVGEYVFNTQGNTIVIYLSIILLFVLGYRLFLEQQTIKREISQLVEALAKKKK